MLRKVFWSVSSFLVVILLLLVSCGPRAAPAPTPTLTPAPALTPAAPTPTPTPTPAPVALAEKPKYGGTLLVILPAFPAFTETFTPGTSQSVDLAGYVYEQFTNADWSKGKAGTGEVDYGAGPTAGNTIASFENVAGYLAEKWATPEIGVWVLDIRKGVHFALNPASEASRLVNGREMTADDVTASILYMRDTPGARTLLSQPGLIKNVTIDKTGPWQITVKTPVDPGVGYSWLMGGGAVQYGWAKEWLEKYGKANDWRNTVGTGPYMLTDFVSGSLLTLTRNPSYWQKDPVGPGKGNQLPYPDGVKIFIVPDISTRLATMRTGRADWVSDIQLEDATGLIRTSPKPQSYKFLSAPSLINMRVDKQDLPFKDKRVRQALMMAIDFEAIKRDLYAGEAEILAWPVEASVKQIYTPLNQMPAPVQALFKHNIEGARKLLAEAGYTNGFKTKMIVQNAAAQADQAAVLKDMWAKVGVDLEIQPREPAVFQGILNSRSYEEMLLRGGSQIVFSGLNGRYGMNMFRGPSSTGRFNDPVGTEPVIEAAFQEVQKNIFVNNARADQLIRELIPYILEQAYYISLPAPYSYRLWQPWVKNYYGEAWDKYWVPYVWVDQDLKEELTGRR